jgi:hypothetical protein
VLKDLNMNKDVLTKEDLIEIKKIIESWNLKFSNFTYVYPKMIVLCA